MSTMYRRKMLEQSRKESKADKLVYDLVGNLIGLAVVAWWVPKRFQIKTKAD